MERGFPKPRTKEAADPGVGGQGLRRRRLSERKLALLFVTPALGLLALTLLWPLVLAVDLSLRDVRFIGKPGEFVGLANYTDVLGEARFWQSGLRSLIWVAGNAVVQTALALAAALVLHQSFPGVRIARVWVLLTWIVPTVVVVIIWRWLLSNSGGMINPLLVQAGLLEAPVGFFSSRESAMTTLVLINSWRWFPFVTLMILAALTRIPGDLDEAARMDGAGAWQRFRRITWPLLQPTLSVLLVVGTLLSFNVFDIIWLTTAGGPSGGTQTLPVLIYETAFKGYELSRAAAISVLTGLALMGFAIAASRSMTREEGA
ncbi:MAG: sugar ABC transporter permease [Rhodobacteraceae bacterium]|nr:sugar ABC transporter permease [Paracoccaceae bacterium]